MELQDAATIPSVYLASIYSLFDLANLNRGQVRALNAFSVTKFTDTLTVCSHPLRIWWSWNCLYPISSIHERTGKRKKKKRMTEHIAKKT